MRTTREVIDDHLRRAREGDIDGDLAANYSKDVVMLVDAEVHHGRAGARLLADRLAEEMPAPSFEYRHVTVAGDVALLVWTGRSGEVFVDDGVDSFAVRDGLIVGQTIHYTVSRPGGTRPKHDAALEVAKRTPARDTTD